MANSKKPTKAERGRPTKYKPEFCRRVIEYFDVPLTYEEEVTVTTKDGSYTKKVVKVTDLPTFERFAHELNVNHSTLRQWCKDYPEFSKSYDEAKDLQEQLIVANAMAGRYVGPFAQFYLKNRYNYADKQEIEHSGDVGLFGNDALTVRVVDAGADSQPQATDGV